MGAAQVQAMELINTALYPIDDLGSSKAQALISRCRATLKRDGICALDDFLLPEIAQQVLNACRPLIPLGTRQQGTVTPYFGKEEGLHPPGHSTNFHMSRDYVFVHGGLIHVISPMLVLNGQRSPGRVLVGFRIVWLLSNRICHSSLPGIGTEVTAQLDGPRHYLEK